MRISATAEEQAKAMSAIQSLLGPHERVHHHGRQALNRFAEADFAGDCQEAKSLNEASVEVMADLRGSYRNVFPDTGGQETVEVRPNLGLSELF